MSREELAKLKLVATFAAVWLGQTVMTAIWLALNGSPFIAAFILAMTAVLVMREGFI